MNVLDIFSGGFQIVVVLLVGLALDASSVIGSLAGLAEITSEAFGKNGAGPGARPATRPGSVPAT